MAAPPFDRFVRHAELSALVSAMAEERPDLLAVSSIGESYEGRDIWLLTVTNTATGPAAEKPALWVDANIHATELTGSVAALHLASRLVTGHGVDREVTRALDTRAFYIVPRLNPDGAELALGERPVELRSSTRPYPRTDQQDGLVEEDLDGDGRLLTMRIPDPDGPWKPLPSEPRLLVPRDPAEDGDGPYYRLLPEGRIQGYDGATIRLAPRLQGLDMNRNWPIDWRPEGDQPGAGPYPTSEPEIRAAVQAIVDRPNICAYIAYHTQSGVHLRPSSTKDDDSLPTADLRAYQVIGEAATARTGYPALSVFHGFRYDPKDVITGVADDWAYEHLGVFAWTTELWSPLRAAGIEDFDVLRWYDRHPVDDDLKLLAWNDEQLGGQGYVDWYPYDHPQLGPVELGGWWSAHCWRNPPPTMLEAEVAPHSEWAIWHALVSPLLRLRSLEATPIGDGGDSWRVRLVVANAGWLPTNVTARALERKAVRPLEAELLVPPGSGARVVGDARVERGQLVGRSEKTGSPVWGPADPTDDRATIDWVVTGPAGTVVQVEARHQRAGVVRGEVVLGS